MNCLWCGQRPRMVEFCDGVCLECGDKMMTQDKPTLIRGLAKAVAEVKRLESLHKSDSSRGGV